jgi:hypothetical protein
MPNSTMTNAAVTQQVKKVEGNTLSLKYKDGEKTIIVPPESRLETWYQDFHSGVG